MNRLTTLTLFTFVGLLWACGGGETPQEGANTGAQAPAAAAQPASDLTPEELEQGIGIVRDLELGPIDEALAAEGEAAFQLKCSACHRLDERYVAPPLGQVLSRRRPEFVMNMMMNASEMVQRHPVIRELLAEYYTPMTVQVTEVEEARAILEYLRSAQIPDDPAGNP